jgi:uncharacterized FlaG/YvyC family protein
VVSAGQSQQVANAAQSAPAGQAAAKAVQPVQAPRRAPVTDGREIHLAVESDTHEVIASLVDTDTDEVIRQIPAEATRRASEVIRAITGQLIDKVV